MMWGTSTLRTLADEDLGTLAENDPLIVAEGDKSIDTQIIAFYEGIIRVLVGGWRDRCLDLELPQRTRCGEYRERFEVVEQGTRGKKA